MQQKLVGGSVSFDNASAIYDKTRALTPEIAAKQTEALLTELRAIDTDSLLEVGIGTGRIARPLMGRGVRVTGVDLAPKMVEQLLLQLTPSHRPPDLAFADATRLPFRDGSFRGVLMVHVLHLVSDWRATIAEMRRVLADGGVFLHDITVYPEDNPGRTAWNKRKELFAKHAITTRLRPDPEQIVQQLRDVGGTVRTVIYAEDEERQSVQEIVDNLQNRVDSSTWEIPAEKHAAYLRDFEDMCRSEFGDLQKEYNVPVQYTLEVWSFA